MYLNGLFLMAFVDKEIQKKCFDDIVIKENIIMAI